jgi:hypothetical protein
MLERPQVLYIVWSVILPLVCTLVALDGCGSRILVDNQPLLHVPCKEVALFHAGLLLLCTSLCNAVSVRLLQGGQLLPGRFFARVRSRILVSPLTDVRPCPSFYLRSPTELARWRSPSFLGRIRWCFMIGIASPQASSTCILRSVSLRHPCSGLLGSSAIHSPLEQGSWLRDLQQ